MEQKLDYTKNLDQLLGEFSQPRQDFTPKPPPGPQPKPAGQFSGQFSPWPTEGEGPEPDTRTPEEVQRDIMAAERTGHRIAKTVDGIASFTAALIAREKETAKYKATPGDVEDLSEAWAAVAEKYQFDVNPWFTVAFLNLTVYGPIFMKANNDRRFNQMNAEIKAMQQQIEDLKTEKQKATEKPS